MILIYHNPDSIESLACLNLLKKVKQNYRIIKYLDNHFTERKLKRIIKLLNVKPIELIRTEDDLWRDHFQSIVKNNDEFDDIEYIKMMIEFPILIRRPIIINGKKAIIAKPPNKMLEILSN
jgi:arsenate reductase